MSRYVNVYISVMQEQLIEQFNQLLVLSGPAGSGKSTMIQLLAAEDNIPIVEWETILDRYNEPGMYYILFILALIFNMPV